MASATAVAKPMVVGAEAPLNQDTMPMVTTDAIFEDTDEARLAGTDIGELVVVVGELVVVVGELVIVDVGELVPDPQKALDTTSLPSTTSNSGSLP